MIDYIIDPEFKSLIHPLSDEEFNQLEDNIVKDGKLLSPIIIWSETGIIVDGHNRYEIIKRHPEITIWTNYKHFADRYEVISWICNNQLGRRNINDDQRARLIGLRYDAEKHTNGASDGFRGNQYISGAEDEPKDKVVVTKKCEVPKSTAEKLAEEYGVSKNTIINYGKFAEGVDIADSISPGISQEILSGKIKVKQKDLIALANAPVDERKQRVEWILHVRPEPTRFCIDTLLPQGLCMLGGAPKIGKSWMVLDWCVRVAQGSPVWGLNTVRGTVLYLCLEDSFSRISRRLAQITDEATDNVFFAVSAKSMADGLTEQIRSFCHQHPDTVLVAIDTFQLIRQPEADSSYASDYNDMRTLKALADELGITLLLVHHLRKQGDSDPLNKLSGTTGISGATDAVYVLDKSRRSSDGATLFCTGRDIESREIELRFDSENCLWNAVGDSLHKPEMKLPAELLPFPDFVKTIAPYEGSNTELSEKYFSFCGINLSPKALKQLMNRNRFLLESFGVFYESKRTNGQRFVKIFFPSADESRDSSDGNDGIPTVGETCVPSVPCVPDGECGNT